jgi:hypothetical protein
MGAITFTRRVERYVGLRGVGPRLGQAAGPSNLSPMAMRAVADPVAMYAQGGDGGVLIVHGTCAFRDARLAAAQGDGSTTVLEPVRDGAADGPAVGPGRAGDHLREGRRAARGPVVDAPSSRAQAEPVPTV